MLVIKSSASSFQTCKQFVEAGFMAEADLDSSCLLNKKIRNAQLAQYNYIFGKKMGSSCSGGRARAAAVVIY